MKIHWSAVLFLLISFLCVVVALVQSCSMNHTEVRWTEKNRHDECMAAIAKDPGKANTICRGRGGSDE